MGISLYRAPAGPALRGLRILATLLAALGVYGVVAYTVARRTPIGIRMALGALPGCGPDGGEGGRRHGGRRGDAGVGRAWGLSRYLKSELYGVRADDPAIFAAAALALLAVAFLAILVPGRRAARIAPIAALKYE